MAQNSESPAAVAQTHPLNSPWSVYYSSAVNKSAQDRYQENLKLVARLSTLEDYAALYARVKRPSALEIDQGIFLARGELMPSWEALPEGGCWCYRIRFSYRRAPRFSATQTNRIWERASLAVLGEQIREPTVVCISYLAKEDCDVIRIWVSDVSNADACRRIPLKLSEVFDCKPEWLEFKRNKAAMQASAKKDSHIGAAHGAAGAPAGAGAGEGAAEAGAGEAQGQAAGQAAAGAGTDPQQGSAGNAGGAGAGSAEAAPAPDASAPAVTAPAAAAQPAQAAPAAPAGAH